MERYQNECRLLFDVLEERLKGCETLCNESRVSLLRSLPRSVELLTIVLALKATLGR
jgi:hypothetical protein